MSSIAARFRALGAHNDVVEWAAPYGEDGAALWAACPRGDWLLGLAARLGGSKREVIRAAAACAELAFDHLPDDASAPREALDAARGFVADEGGGNDGDAQRAEAREGARASLVARLTADAETALDPASGAATAAVLSVLLAMESVDSAPLVVANLVQAAVFDAGECAMMASVRYVHAETADRVREVFPPAWATAALG